MPIFYRTGSNSPPAFAWSTPATANKSIVLTTVRANEPVLLNVGAFGYYRTQYSPELYERLTQALEADANVSSFQSFRLFNAITFALSTLEFLISYEGKETQCNAENLWLDPKICNVAF